MSDFPVISLFTGAMGLDLGLRRAGYDIRVAVEPNRYASETIRSNHLEAPIPVFTRKIEMTRTEEILDAAALRVGEAFLVTGGPCCQSFSTVGTRRSVDDPRGMLFDQFLRVVREARPRFFIMENVRGLLSAAKKHRPLNQRGPGHPPIEPDEELGSALTYILEEFRKSGYHTVFDLLNTANYGVPQVRERVIFVGSRDGCPISMPEPTHSKDGTGGHARWLTLREGLLGLEDPNPVYIPFSETIKGYLDRIPAGCNWHFLPIEEQRAAIGAAFDTWGGRSGFLRRLDWQKPSPSLTGDPNGRATTMCHPDETRPLSVREYARLQQFPDDWYFAGTARQQYDQIGNAVPVALAEAIGRTVLRASSNQSSPELLGQVICHNSSLLKRMAKCPITKLNPPRMRTDQSVDAAKAWLNGRTRSRSQILQYGSYQRSLDLELADNEGTDSEQPMRGEAA